MCVSEYCKVFVRIPPKNFRPKSQRLSTPILYDFLVSVHCYCVTTDSLTFLIILDFAREIYRRKLTVFRRSKGYATKIIRFTFQSMLLSTAVYCYVYPQGLCFLYRVFCLDILFLNCLFRSSNVLFELHEKLFL